MAGGTGLGSGAEKGTTKKDADDEEEKRRRKRKKKRGERAEAVGSAQNSTDEDQNSSGEEEEQPRTVERRIFRRHKTRKLRKLNDGGKLEIVQIKTHNSSDFSDMVSAGPCV